MSNITIYREKPLDDSSIKKIDLAISPYVRIEETFVREVYQEVGLYGEVEEKGKDVCIGLSAKSLQVMPDALLESVLRPISPKHVGYHLTRLTVHKPFSRGEQFFQLAINDFCKDLEGVSEYALIKTCEYFRLSREKFFPDTGDFVNKVKNLDYSLKNPILKSEVSMKQEAIPNKTDKSKLRVRRLVKLAGKPKSRWTIWEKRFYTALETRPNS
jgi:hypothetical protein